MNKIRVLSLFSGIGAFEKALSNIGILYELVNFCEIDKYAIKSYCAIHDIDEKINLGDITKVDLDNLPKNIDLLTHGSPCQDYSLAGKQAGGDKGSGTRSSLMWNSVEIIKRIKPRYIIWENVKGVLSNKNKHNFEQYIEDLKEVGYTSSWKVLNSCDFGVPQNRERIFCVSILGQDKFEFPEAPNTPCKLSDILESNVENKYFIDKPFTLTNKEDGSSTCRRVANVELNGHDYIKRVYDTERCSPTLPTGTGGNHEPKILQLCKSARDCDDAECTYEEKHRVRKLTPKEYWRLQTFDDKDYNRCTEIGISNAQLYKQAGNSITVRVLEYIFKELFKENIE